MSKPDPVSAPYGTFALSPVEESLRRWATGLPGARFRRSMESVVRRILMRRGREIADVEVFPGQRARLHLTDNRCEKRVFAGARNWDREERDAIRRAVQAHTERRDLVFVDAGANAGFYSLSVLADAHASGIPVKVLSVEPDRENRRRLEFNISVSEAEDVVVLPYALGATSGEIHLVEDSHNRGEVRVVESGGDIVVPMRTLAQCLEEAGADRIDIMKMDIEGYETPVLEAFFSAMAREAWPKLILLETKHQDTLHEGASGLCLEKGYEIAEEMRQNTVLVLPERDKS